LIERQLVEVCSTPHKTRTAGFAALGLTLVLAGGGYLRAQKPKPSPQRALLDKYCVTCHNQAVKTAGLMLDKMDLDRVGENAEVWEKVVRKLRGGMMPPLGMPHPDGAAV